MDNDQYLMENSEEALRLDVKTDPDAVRKQIELCGIFSGARVLDGGCGSGKTTSLIHEMVQPGGSAVGIDFAQSRIDFAKKYYGDKDGIDFRRMDLRDTLEDLGQFDFIWLRFVLEYYLEGSMDILHNVGSILKPGGKLCLLDLDNNCLSHWPIRPDQDEILHNILRKISCEFNFDPFAGKKLYTYLYDLGFQDIEANIIPHHLIFGDLKSSDSFNWIKKIEMATVKARDMFEYYPGKHDGFFADFNAFFSDPRRFTYTPLIICCGKKPV